MPCYMMQSILRFNELNQRSVFHQSVLLPGRDSQLLQLLFKRKEAAYDMAAELCQTGIKFAAGFPRWT